MIVRENGRVKIVDKEPVDIAFKFAQRSYREQKVEVKEEKKYDDIDMLNAFTMGVCSISFAFMVIAYFGGIF